MSAPDTRLSRQKKRHRGPLIGIAVVVTLVLILFVWMVGREVDEVTPAGEPPAEAEAPAPAQPDDSQVIAPQPDEVPPAEGD